MRTWTFSVRTPQKNRPIFVFFCLCNTCVASIVAVYTSRVHSEKCFKSDLYNFHHFQYPIEMFIIITSKTEHCLMQVQGCALTAPGRLRRLKLDFGRLRKNSGHPTGHSCLKFSLEVKRVKNITVFKPIRKIL